MQNSIAMFIFSAFYWNYPFWQNLVQLIKIVRLSSNLVPTISQINYWKNCWKNFCKLWDGPHCKNKSGLFPLLIVAVYWQSSNTKACVKKPCQILANNIDNGGRWIALIVYVRYCLKEYMKNKKGFGKPWHFSNLMTDWATPGLLWPSKKLKCQNYGEIKWISSLKVNIPSIHSVLFSWHAILLEHQ